MERAPDRRVEERMEYFKKAREVRRGYANWDFIRSQPQSLRVALEY